MSRDRGRLAGQIQAYLDRASTEQRGKMIVVLWCNAVTAVVVNGTLGGCLTLSAVRIWRSRDEGWRRAIVDEGAWKSVGLLAATSVIRRAIARSVIERMTTQRPET